MEARPKPKREGRKEGTIDPFFPPILRRGRSLDAANQPTHISWGNFFLFPLSKNIEHRGKRMVPSSPQATSEGREVSEEGEKVRAFFLFFLFSFLPPTNLLPLRGRRERERTNGSSQNMSRPKKEEEEETAAAAKIGQKLE